MEAEMGLNAELIAIGPYRKSVSENLEYPPEYYENIPEGTPIITLVCCCVTSDSSKALAHALGAEAWSLGEHCELRLSIDKLDQVEAAEAMSSKDMADLVALSKAGFKFYYRPCG
jgi:hypothetical protein